MRMEICKKSVGYTAFDRAVCDATGQVDTGKDVLIPFFQTTTDPARPLRPSDSSCPSCSSWCNRSALFPVPARSSTCAVRHSARQAPRRPAPARTNDSHVFFFTMKNMKSMKSDPCRDTWPRTWRSPQDDPLARHPRTATAGEWTHRRCERYPTPCPVPRLRENLLDCGLLSALRWLI